MTSEALIDAVFDAARFDEDEVDIDARWIAGVVLIADVLLRVDEFNRERRLRGLERELRGACADISAIMRSGNKPN